MKSTLLNPETITKWYRVFDELVRRTASRRAVKIGGEGVVVEVDEMKLGQVKYNRGHRVESAWIVNGIERTSPKRKFSVHVMRRNKETLERVISENVEEKSIVFTDCWGTGSSTRLASSTIESSITPSISRTRKVAFARTPSRA